MAYRSNPQYLFPDHHTRTIIFDDAPIVRPQSEEVLVHTGPKTGFLVEKLATYQRESVPVDEEEHFSPDEIVENALRTPWALDYELTRPKTNHRNHSVPGRLGSATIVQTNRRATPLVLTIPEPKLVSLVAARPISSRGPSKTVFVAEKNQRATMTGEEIEEIFERVYGDERRTHVVEQSPVAIIYEKTIRPVTVSPRVYVYEKSDSWRPENEMKPFQVSAIPINPNYLHRPGVVEIRNPDKNSVIKIISSTKTNQRQSSALVDRLTLEIDGVRLRFDPKLSIFDSSKEISKYYIDGRLYLIKDHRYNVFDNVDATIIDKLNRQTSKPTKYRR